MLVVQQPHAEAQSPSVERRVAGTTRADDDADRSRRRDVTSATDMAYGPIFSTGAGHLCPKKFSAAPEKNSYANLQNYFARLTHPVIISKNPGFRALFSPDRMNSVFFV